MTSKDADVSILELIDLQQSNCLNESSEHNLASIVGLKKANTSSSFLLSDADEQLLITIAFNQSVRVKSLLIQTSDAAKAPRIIKLVVNNPSLGFEDVDSADESQVAQVLELSEEDVAQGNPIALRFVRFQKVNSLHIFVASNHGEEDESRIDKIDIFGVPVETTKDLSGLRNQEHDHMH